MAGRATLTTVPSRKAIPEPKTATASTQRPRPLLAGLERSDDRVPADLRVGAGVAVWRAIAAADMSALQADAQMQPRIAPGQALLASLHGLRESPDLDVIEVRASRHRNINEGRLAPQPRLLKVEPAPPPPHHIGADLARVPKPDELLALRGVDLVRHPLVGEGPLLDPIRVLD